MTNDEPRTPRSHVGRYVIVFFLLLLLAMLYGLRRGRGTTGTPDSSPTPGATSRSPDH